MAANAFPTAYIRIGSVTRVATREQLLMLGAASGSLHTELMPVNRTSFESLDQARLENYLCDILKDPEVLDTKKSWIIRLKALGFMTEGVGDDPVCTIAGLVLFGVRPRKTLKQAGIRLMFFDSIDKEYQAQLDKVIDAPLVGRFQVAEAGKSLIDAGLIERTVEAMEPFVTVESNAIDEHFRRDRIWFYPYEALRELIINALAHRDWSRFMDIEICGYQDRLEVLSPGALPNSMTIEKMRAGQRSARNHIIVEVMRDYGYVDARGMGIRTKVIPLTRQLTGRDPDFEVTEDYVKTTIHAKSVPENVPENKKVSLKNDIAGPSSAETVLNNPLQEKLLDLIQANPRITYDDLAEQTGQNRKKIQRQLQVLKRMRLLRRIGAAKGGYWEVDGG